MLPDRTPDSVAHCSAKRLRFGMNLINFFASPGRRGVFGGAASALITHQCLPSSADLSANKYLQAGSMLSSAAWRVLALCGA